MEFITEMAMLQELLKTPDKELEEGFDDLIKLISSPDSMYQAKIEKIAQCRAEQLTTEDLLEETTVTIRQQEEIIKGLSPIKQRLMEELFNFSIRINREIIEQGLHSRANVRFQKMEKSAYLPEYGHEIGDSGADLRLLEDIVIPAESVILARTGLKVVIPVGFEIQIRPRSGLSAKPEFLGMFVANAPGTIDANFRGEIKIILKNLGKTPISIDKGTKIAQAVLAPVTKMNIMEIMSVDDFPTDRGEKGFGSTGVK